MDGKKERKMKNEESKRKARGSKLVRSETVTIRLDPKLRYLAELAARKQRRTLSSFIEWAIEDSLSRVILGPKWFSDTSSGENVMDAASYLWDVDEADRFAKLAFNFPDLLNHDEQILWKLICETGYLWKGHPDQNGKWEWTASAESLGFQLLRDYWETLLNVASGNAEKDILPKTPALKASNSSSAQTSSDDEIPF